MARYAKSNHFPVCVSDPPTDPPVIHSSSSESFVSQGDPLTLTCSVRGGKPVTETSVTFDCPNKPDMTDVEGTTEVSSSLVFDPVAVSDNGRVCTCRPQWKTYDWYTPQKQTTVTVYCECLCWSDFSLRQYLSRAKLTNIISV